MNKERRINNRYIDLVDHKPDYIVVCATGKPSQAELDLLESRKAQYQDHYVELGAGSGGHLVQQALQNPSGLYLGFELRYKRIYRSAEKSQQLGLENILFLKTEAELISNFFAPSTLNGVYINFPDPWDKRSWKKHRLLKQEYLEKIFLLLKPEGFLSFKTDHQEYFQAVHTTLLKQGLYKLTEYSDRMQDSSYYVNNISTEFEQLFRNKGQPIYYLKAQKIIPKD